MAATYLNSGFNFDSSAHGSFFNSGLPMRKCRQQNRQERGSPGEVKTKGKPATSSLHFIGESLDNKMDDPRSCMSAITGTDVYIPPQDKKNNKLEP